MPHDQNHTTPAAAPAPSRTAADRLTAQPWAGLGGLLLATAGFFALALGTGSTTTSLLILGPISTFALPAVAVIAFWWNDWPGARLTRPWTGLTDTILAAAAAVGLTIAGQAVIERPDVRAVFEAYRGPGLPVTFPATLPLAGAAFAAMLQLSLVCERWPLGGLGRIKSGIAALALCWAIGTAAYFLLASLGYLPAPQRAAAGLHNPGGPVATPDFGAALIAVGVWQAVFFIAWHGWPVSTITRRPLRLLAGNSLVIGLGTLIYLMLRDLAHWAPDAISAACGCVISAILVVAMLFDGWPAALLRTWPRPGPDPRPHRPGRPGPEPRPGRVRRQRALDQGNPGRLDHHRGTQLRRSRHHPAHRHRAPMALHPLQQRGLAHPGLAVPPPAPRCAPPAPPPAAR